MAGDKVKERLDMILVHKNLATSREKAKALIMSGKVYVDGQKEEKAGTLFDISLPVEIRGEKPKYVSRGGLKLEKAIAEFKIELAGKICMDIGASTGGFTDCMLQNGAAKVYAVDVGYGQFDWKLRNDARVVCMEKTNIRYVKEEDIGEKLDFASVDVSFISLSKVFPVLFSLLCKEGEAVALIKPQFEAGREKVGKKGVVREESVHREVIQKIFSHAREEGFQIEALAYSPIKGPEGNIEYLMHIHKSRNEDEGSAGVRKEKEREEIGRVVADAHALL
ncbi:MAG: TlyA family RNA methyltransferase [Johnsonella sp.]|nr:TlyA family RNA methyltransferase [Johnsonella sp.]